MLESGYMSRWWREMDKGALGLLAAIAFTGFLAVISTSPYVAYRHGAATDFIIKYPVYMAIGACAFALASALPKKWIMRGSFVALAIIIPLTFATLFIHGGANVRSHRWIQIPGFSLQPSEFLKPFLAVATAWIIVKWKREGDGRRRMRLACFGAALYAAVIAILMRQTDLGMAAVILSMLGIQLFVAGLPWKYLVLPAGGLAGIVALGYAFVPYVQRRVAGWFASMDCIKNPAEQFCRGLSAITSAGFVYGHSANNKSVVPDVHTDFVFAGMVEATGMVLSLLALGAMFGFVLLVLKRVRAMEGEEGSIAAAGIIGYLAVQMCINLSSNFGIIPAKGMTLPFVSYGGSSFVASSIAAGIVFALLQPHNMRDYHAKG